MSHKHHDASKEVGQAGYGTYLIGLSLAILLTLISFGTVTYSWLTPPRTIYVLAGAAFAQVTVHAVFFLHMSKRSTPFWSAVIFFFMILVVWLLIGGTLFIMFSGLHNMMPATPSAADY